MSLPGPNARRRGRERAERFQAANRAQARPVVPPSVPHPKPLVDAYRSVTYAAVPKRRLTLGRVALAVMLGLVAAAAVSFPMLAMFWGR